MRHIGGRIAVGFATVALGVTATAAIQPAHEVRASLADCQVTAGCIWVNNSYSGTKKHG
jgi:hypothetical protein